MGGDECVLGGIRLGFNDGLEVGILVGALVGLLDGFSLFWFEGFVDGIVVGLSDATCDGL